MTKLLKQAIDQLRELPEEEQDAAADALFAYISSDERQYALRPEQVEEVRQIQNRLQKGLTRLATSAEVNSVRRKSSV
jgi:hypothetical protein